MLFRQDYIHMRFNFTSSADWLRSRWANYPKPHSKKANTTCSQSMHSHHLTLSSELQTPTSNRKPHSSLYLVNLICLLTRCLSPSPALSSHQPEVRIRISHSDQTSSSTNLIQTSLIFHKLLCCTIQINSSDNYSKVSPCHFYLSKRFFFYLAHSKRHLHHEVEKKAWWWC